MFASPPREIHQPVLRRCGIFPLCGQRLENGEGDQPQVDQSPDGKHITSRDEIYMEAVGDLPGVQPVDGQGIGKRIDHNGGQNGQDTEICRRISFILFTHFHFQYGSIFGHSGRQAKVNIVFISPYFFPSNWSTLRSISWSFTSRAIA